MTDRQTLELAGCVEANGRAGRIVETGHLIAPHAARIAGGKLHWRISPRWAKSPLDVLGRPVKPPSDLLDRFVALSDASDKSILDFALRYGTLRRPRYGRKVRKSDFDGREPLKRWRDLSQHAGDLLEIAAHLRAGKQLRFQKWSQLLSAERALSKSGKMAALGSKEEYQRIRAVIRQHRAEGGALDEYFGENEQAYTMRARQYLHSEVAAWNEQFGPVSFAVQEDSKAPTGWKTVLDFGGSMICYIGFQLMLVIAGGDVYTCSACARPYIRLRGRHAPRGFRKAPKAGEANYCGSEACIRERNRRAQQRRRQRLSR
jgi:hypothetical protein